MLQDPILTGGKKDPVTGFYTKEEFMPFLERLREASESAGKPFAMITFTLDQFTRSSRWDSTEDMMINFFASAFRLACPVKDDYVIFRCDDNKNIGVFAGKSSRQLYAAGKAMERKLKRTPYVWNKWVHKLSFSGGIAAYPVDGKDVRELAGNSERAMNTAIRLGRGRVCQFSQQWHESLKPFLIPIPIALVVIILAVFFTYKSMQHKPAQARPIHQILHTK